MTGGRMKRTFIVDFATDPVDHFRGKVRHVATGEELVFSSPDKLVDFMERMSAAGGTEGVSWPPGMIGGDSKRKRQGDR